MLQKNAFLKTLDVNDQTTICDANINLAFHFCLSEYLNANTGGEQFSWLLMNNPLAANGKLMNLQKL